MASATVHKSQETGNFVVVKDNQILHTFPTEGEANLQVLAIEQAEEAEKEAKKAEAKEAKAEAKDAKHHEEDDEAANNKSGAKPGLRHR